MANRRLIECKSRGCYKLTRNESAYCDEHIEEFEKKEKERRKNFNSYYNKNNKYNKFYWTQKWKQLREYVLARDDYLCQDCLNNKVITEATEVHHIEKIRKAWDKRYDPDNCIALCSECHRIRDRNC
ncbi:HNH endonuclease [Clostridium saudiense]|jgi:5-methylcytosine-specific restriction protein A|uniref:HNH endonuclease n=1 Tax=Clostridium saudiense TaxID=1414720 RepID=UPI0020705D13|nr:MAG TPA: HNH endonuclease [Caudoviricetes sp.]